MKQKFLLFCKEYNLTLEETNNGLKTGEYACDFFLKNNIPSYELGISYLRSKSLINKFCSLFGLEGV